MPRKQHCVKCDRLDDDEMVQCDQCDCWYHFACAHVGSDIADRSWICEACFESTATTTSGTTASSTPVGATTTVLPTSATTTAHISSTSSTAFLPYQTQAAVSHVMATTTTSKAFSSSSNVYVTAGIPSAANARPLPATHESLFRNQDMRHLPASYESCFGTQNNCMVAAPISGTSQRMTNTQPNMQMSYKKDLQIQRLEEEMKLKQEFIETKYKILAQGEETHLSSAQTTMFANTPTAAQLAARQVLPKKLPVFHGDPEDWPLFISSFEHSTNAAGFSNAENLIRLQDSLKGKAREMVRSKLCLPDMVPGIISTLRMCFGRPEHILERLICKAKSMPPIKDKLETLIDFSLSVQNICATMESCQMYTHMHNSFLVKELVEKLPNSHKLSWAMHPKNDNTPIVKVFDDWLYKMAEAASTVVSISPNKNASVNTHIVESDNNDSDKRNTNKCYICDKPNHTVATCEVFKNASLSRKWDFVREKHICRQCLNVHRRKCSSTKVCDIDGCKSKHHPMLHNNKIETGHQAANHTANAPENLQVNTHNCTYGASHPCFRIVPITIRAKGKTINTFAFLDEGSAVTLIEKRTLNELGIDGKLTPLCLKWTGDTTRMENDSIMADVKISSASNSRTFRLKDVHTVENLKLPVQSINANDIVQKHPYLRGLPLQSYENARPTILIGVNNWRLAVPLKIKEGRANEPIASKCRLGWTFQGCESYQSSEYHTNVHVCDCREKDLDLHETVKEFFNIENSKATSLISADDSRAMKIIKETCKKNGDRYEIGLPWKIDNINLPPSYPHALHRLNCLQKKFNKETRLKATIQTQIDNIIEKGYARELTDDEVRVSNPQTWYIPIFVVKNPNKPEKVRLVWDAAAKSNGASLNDFLLSGPDLLNSLVEILLAFRVGKIAVCGDIAEMFHRIKVRQSDMHAQRFLWYKDDDPKDHPSSFVMSALTFGISCAPCIAHYVRDINAEQFRGEFPRAVEAVHKYHYVDDFIDSVDDEPAAIELAKRVRQIHSAAGFHMRNWSSNSISVLNELEADTDSGQSSREWGSATKVLGMYWDPANDLFKYIFRFARLRRDVINEPLVPSKRETLQVLMSIYDPLGFVSCYTTSLKILLQEIWRSGIDWDEQLPDALYRKWCQWKATIPVITAVRVPRCYSLALKSACEVQLHTFVDAGANAYTAVSYLRVVHSDSISIALVAAKSKVAPLKPLSIPRLELQAAITGLRLAKQVLKVERIRTTSQFYWTDSKTTLRWLRLDPKGFQQFVMHRIGEIIENSNINQWKYVPSALNPADIATKTTSRVKDKFWFEGPDFLSSDSSNWPRCESFEKISDSDEPELRHSVLTMQTLDVRPPDFQYFSSWKRLQRAVATFILFIKKAIAASKKVKGPTDVTAEMYESARTFLLKYAQAAEYSEEIFKLKRKKPVEKNSKLISLNVYLDENEVLKCRGRAEHLNNHGDVIVLPQNHRVTFLIVRWFHERLHHQMHETVINRVRAQFYIPRLRVLYRNVRISCQICKNNNVSPKVPQMAPLPAARLAAFERPFTYTGIDYFGPLFVSVGRHREKRWGVIFTCLTVRAIHMEVAHSLDTSSCIMAVQNFISRRGTPREIYSDNGTNFKAASKILSDHIKWNFNPPSSPHMGGAWERLIRSVKNVLYGICPTMRFNDESLRCTLNEVEFTINARPLTFVSVESADDEAITPNHQLIGASDGYKPIFSENADLRQRWHQTQKFSNQFWRRWLKEYVPTICRRNKWFVKRPPVKIGDIVIIVDPDLPRNSWPKGVVIDVIVAKDGQARTVTVKTQSSILQRPVAKIAVLDVSGSG